MQDKSKITYPVAKYTVFPCGEREPGWASAEIEALKELEAETGVSRIRREAASRKRKELIERTVRYWPVLIGGIVACFAPLLLDAIAPLGPWGMRVLFPLVTLASYHGLQLGLAAAVMLPKILLYAQFPVEGFLARMLLRKRVTLTAVAGQVFFFHLLGAIGLWFMRGGLPLDSFR